MHDTALITGKAFFENYGNSGDHILDVGAMDVNGSLRQFAPEGSDYLGIDIRPGPGVDLVIPTWWFPFKTETFDLVVSTSCFEHDPLFWLTFKEMAKVVKSGGFIYISVPVNGPYHGHPGDCWRFYADSGKALETWSQHSGYSLALVESFQMHPIRDIWTDQVMIFGRRPLVYKPKIQEIVHGRG